MLSLRKYLALSVAAAAAVFYHAFATRIQFFPAAMYLSTSKLAVAVVGNLSFAAALCMYNLVIKVFLGTLREIELERVKEKLSSAIMETCLALTIFREEFNMSFVGMFTVLTFVKVFHWLVQDRVDYIEVTPSVSRLAHMRIVSFLIMLLGLDILFLHQTIAATLAQKGHSVQLLFAFEYIILASAAAATFLKYVLSMLDAAMEGRWDGKGTYVFYLELLTDMLHLFVYCIFFVIVFTNYGLPLHLIRDLYMTFRNFRNRISDFLRFRQVTARMDRFPDATPADLERCDGICIICREEMVATGLNKKLHCGHVFHLHCLRSWLERQQNCPTCRTSVFRAPPPPDPVAVGVAPNAAADAAAAPAAALAAAAPAAAVAAGVQGIAAPAGGAGTPAAAAAAPPNAAAAAGAAFIPGTRAAAAGPSPADAAVSHRAAARSRSPRGHAGAGSSRAAAAGGAVATGESPAAAAAGGIPQFYMQNAAGVPAGLVWQMPQWYPVTSMAAFSNAPLQYAGQQSPLDQALDQTQAQALAAASMVPMVPAMIPAISAPFPAVIPPVSAGATPEQAQAAAAAAAMAAAAAAMYMPPMMPGLAMMPPAMLPAASAGAHGEQMAAAAAANAAAAAAAAAVMGGAAPTEVMQASYEATQQMLQRQLDYLQSQLSRIRGSEGLQQAQGDAAAAAPAPAAAAANSTANTAPGSAAAVAGVLEASGEAAPSSGGALSSNSSSSAPALAAAVTSTEQSSELAASSSKEGADVCETAQAAKTRTAAAAAAAVESSVLDGEQARSSVGAAANGAAEGGTDADELRRMRLKRFEME